MASFTDEQKTSIIKMLEDNVPIVDIVDMYNLEDADVIYDITYGTEINNRITQASAKYSRSIINRKIETSYEVIENAIQLLTTEKKELHVLEHGCGNGSFTFRLAKKFPDVFFDAIDLSEAGTGHANEHFNLPNTRYWQADGYAVDSDKSYDLVIHVNVLEHVPDGTKYIKAGLSLLKEDGLLLFGFPRLSYWKVWGLPKYLYCRFSGKAFQTHSFDEKNVTKLLEQDSNLINIGQFSHGLFPPRRIYYYLPNSLLSKIGKILELVENNFRDVGINAPFMFSIYGITRKNKSTNSNLFDFTKKPIKNRISSFLLFPFSILIFSLFWLFSSTLMVFEVISGRKRFIRQE